MTSRQHVEMKRLWAQNYPVKIIARKLGVKVDAVTSHAQWFRDEFPARRNGFRKTTAEEAREMKRMRDDGMLLKDIAAKFGCTDSTVRRNVRRVS